MRRLAIAITALVLRVLTPRILRPRQQDAPAMQQASASFLNRDALSVEQAALIASLWPEARPCAVPAQYLQFSAPAIMGALQPVTWQAPSRHVRASRRTERPRAEIAWAA